MVAARRSSEHLGTAYLQLPHRQAAPADPMLDSSLTGLLWLSTRLVNQQIEQPLIHTREVKP
jgi:hypothetical protein